MDASDEGGREKSCALFAGSILFSTGNFLRGPLSPIKTRQTRQIGPNLLITLSKLMSGCSKKTRQTPDKFGPETRQIVALSFPRCAAPFFETILNFDTYPDKWSRSGLR